MNAFIGIAEVMFRVVMYFWKKWREPYFDNSYVRIDLPAFRFSKASLFTIYRGPAREVRLLNPFRSVNVWFCVISRDSNEVRLLRPLTLVRERLEEIATQSVSVI